MRHIVDRCATFRAISRNCFVMSAMQFSPQTPLTLPKSKFTAFGAQLSQSLSRDITSIQNELMIHEERRGHLMKETAKIIANSTKITFQSSIGQIEDTDRIITENEALINNVLGSIGDDVRLRDGRLSQAIEQFIQARLFFRFLQTGRLESLASFAGATDEEYLGGVLAMCQDVARYASGRACEEDFTSVNHCHSFLVSLSGKLLEFYFRNNALRPKYDGLKYAVKKLEDIRFDMSSLHSRDEPAAKRRCVDAHESAGLLIDMDDFDQLKSRLDAADLLREKIIKSSRDVQKLSKQAIFGLQGGSIDDASAKLSSAEVTAESLLASIEQMPALRAGSLSNSLEEWGEGMMLLSWTKERRIATMSELRILNSDEYIGALSDFTGEIGRLAVNLAAKRDMAAVQELLQVDMAISSAMGVLEAQAGGNKYNKKAKAVTWNQKKVEDLLYELTMSEKSGRLRMKDVSNEVEPSGDDK